MPWAKPTGERAALAQQEQNKYISKQQKTEDGNYNADLCFFLVYAMVFYKLFATKSPISEVETF